jgi:hypothetical protein
LEKTLKIGHGSKGACISDLGMPSPPTLLTRFQTSMTFLTADIILHNIMESVFQIYFLNAIFEVQQL